MYDDDVLIGSISTVELAAMRRKIESLTAERDRLASALDRITQVLPEVSDERFRLFALLTADIALERWKK